MMAAAARKRGRPRKKPEGSRLHQPSLPPPQKAKPRRTLRPLRRRPLHDFADFDDYLDEEEEEEQDGREKRRKLKLILKLPPPVPTCAEKDKEERPRRAELVARGSSSRSTSASSSSYLDDDEGEEDEAYVKEEEAILPLRKPQPDGCRDGARLCGSGDPERGRKKVLQASNKFVSGVSTSSQAAGTPLPERKLLEAILDKIQKKDTYGVFAEPVDPEELPDYYDVIEHPMDFGTIRKKLASNAYHSFEQFEDNVFLICSNAMQYNAPSTIYFKQARSMQDLGRKEFQKIRTEIKSIENDSKCEEKISFNSKALQNCLPGVVQESFVSDISSATTLASRGDACAGSTVAEACGVEPAATSNGLADGSSSRGENKSEKVVDLNVRNSPSRLGKKSFEVDDNRRATYSLCDQQPATESSPVYDILEGEQRKLVAVGADAEYSYARSLARFAVNLGPIAWRLASQRIKTALPSGVKFGPGWVGEYEPPFTPIFNPEIHPRQQQQQETDSALHSKMHLKMDKAIAMGRKAGGIGNSNQYNIQSQLDARAYGRDSDPVERGNNSSVVTEPGQQSSIVTSRGQPNTDVAVLQQQNKQVTSEFANAAANALKKVQEHHPSSSRSRFANISPGMVSLVRKSMQHESQKQTETTAPCSTTNGLRINDGELRNGKVFTNSTSNNLDNTMRFLSNHQQAVVGDRWTLGSQEHGLADQSKLMGLSINTFTQPNISSNSLKPYPSAVPPSSTDGSNAAAVSYPSAVLPSGREGSNAAAVSYPSAVLPSGREGSNAAAARGWMSIGASSQSKLSVDRMGVSDSPNGSASTTFYGSWRSQNSSPRITDASKMISMPQAFRQPIQMVGLEPQLHNKGLMIFPQVAAGDMSRFQGQIPWQGLVPQIENKQNQNICPPDLNISFQPPGSPVRHSPRMHKDTQQPDLALQL